MTDSVSVPPRLRTANEFARAVAADAFLFHFGWLGNFLSFSSSKVTKLRGLRRDSIPSRAASWFGTPSCGKALPGLTLGQY